MRRSYRLLAFALCLLPRLATAQCGGEERWWVKVGADAGAAGLTTQTPIATSLHDLVRLSRPTLPSDDETRVAAEREVRTVDAYLVKFKKETGKTGDQDYHLVISDQTQLYSKGGAGNPVSPHSFIAEIPDPACVSGRKQTVTEPSHLASQLAQVRSAFEAQYPSPKSGWNETEGTPVRLTGVVFYDRPHGQVGRALNGLELHPLLKIEFNPGIVPPDTSTLVANPGFEQGATGWTATEGVIVGAGSPAARDGHGKAWLGGHGEKKTDRLWQALTLPADVDAIAAAFYLHVETEEESADAYDFLRVRVRDGEGKLLKTAASYSNVNAAAGYRRLVIDLTAYRGQTIRLSFESSEDDTSSTSFVLDDVRVIVEKH